MRTKRTYNLPERTVVAVRELAARYGVAATQDGVIELAVDELTRRLRDDEEAARWEAAAADRRLPGRGGGPRGGLRDRRPRDVAAPVIPSSPLRWAVVRVALDPAVGHEQGGTRRALVVSYEPFHRSGLATVCPITATRAEARYPGEVAMPAGVAGQTPDGVVLCQQLRTIALERLVGSPEGRILDPGLRRAVRAALAHHLGLDIPAVGDGALARA